MVICLFIIKINHRYILRSVCLMYKYKHYYSDYINNDLKFLFAQRFSKLITNFSPKINPRVNSN